MKKNKRLTPEFHDDELYWVNCNLPQLAESFGTPLHVCCREEILHSASSFQRSFEQTGVHIHCHFSVKTNPIPEFLKILREADFGMEIVSPYELWLVQRLGFSGDEIVITGLKPQTEFCIEAASVAPKMWAMESLYQLEFLASVCDNFPKPVNIGLRLCPGLRRSRFNLTLSSGSHRSPHGFLPHSAELDRALQIVTENKKFNFVGFHIHLGSGILSSRPYRHAFSKLFDVIVAAAQKGCISHLINIGGGFGCASAPVHSATDFLRSFYGSGRQKHQAGQQTKLLSQVAAFLRKLIVRLKNEGIDIKEILAEPGRSVSAPTQVLLLTAEEVIERTGERRFLICDGGAMSLSPMLLIERHRVLPLKRRPGETFDYTVLGNLPSSLDIVANSVPLPLMAPGDRLAILDTGAYFYSFNNNFAGPRAAVALIEKGEFRLIRERERFEDIVKNQL